MIRISMLLAVAALLAAAGASSIAQGQNSEAQEQTEQPEQSAAEQSTVRYAPPGAFVIPSGTHILVALEDKLSTKDDKRGKPFRARTLDVLTTADGREFAAGALIYGHIDKVEAAEKTGRARLWLTFDDIQTRGGRRPLVADLIDAPGVHSIHVVFDHEGEIVAGTSKKQQQEQAAAAAAITGAAAGVATKNPKEAAMGAGVGALTAFLVTSGFGQDLTVDMGTKLELVLARPLAMPRI
jgi:hypothetical protein